MRYQHRSANYLLSPQTRFDRTAIKPCGAGAHPDFEFHVSRRARLRYNFDETLFSTTGNVVFADFGAARRFAHAMNQQRDVARFPELAVKAGQINAMGLIDEIFHLTTQRYQAEVKPGVFREALEWLETKVGKKAVDRTLRQFTDEFPPVAVFKGEVSAQEYLSLAAHRETGIQELVMLWLANANPALEPFIELFDDTNLEANTEYFSIIAQLHDFFDKQPGYGPGSLNLLDLLRAPALAVPNSITGQLEFMLQRWGSISEPFFRRLLLSLDVIQEENKVVFFGEGHTGTAPAQVPDYGQHFGNEEEGSAAWDAPEEERFSPDRDWMPRAVVMAKNAFVWLDQMSKRYQRVITRLDQIPDEELDALAAQGFTGLWLIGLWERSKASRRIKQLCGKEDAHASAYSLHDYAIAGELGGEWSMNNLRERAWQRGIRMASDMVPNHMAIDSRWVMEHPDWFLSVPQPPYPAYTFNGVDLSQDERVGIFLEDHYYSKNDAAVVFKRVDRWSGDERFIYHGNDGTSMPWNDTAQLDYLNPAVREAVIQTILHVARQFPIIRFDAAMTLAKRHFQRLWFPEPGTGGAIPSRSEHSLTKAEFNAAIPEEFWREVVDRVAQEAPDTLLLAEAFWMMEGYFVRTLGMHRVYNSAFMNMLRDEENDKYRVVIKNTLEFDPDILKRFVNFVNNPDEEPAVEQFGKGDKYFGICTLMATLPGLPMFGHGQIEGFHEKYGMEFSRAYWDETPDAELIARHEREIFPLLKRRYLFSEVHNFLLYDFWNNDGSVNEDVYAYSNREGEERGLVIFHNRYAEASGWIRTSIFAMDKASGELTQKTLGNGLGLSRDASHFTIFRDNVTGLQYIRRSTELCERGLFVEMKAYECHVFLDFREVQDDSAHHYSDLEVQLAGRGTPDIEEALRQMELRPVQEPFRTLVNAGLLHRLIEASHARLDLSAGAPHIAILEEIEAAVAALVRGINSFSKQEGDAIAIARETGEGVWAAMQFLNPQNPQTSAERAAVEAHTPAHTALLCWLLVRYLGKIAEPEMYEERSRAYFDEYQWTPMLRNALREFGLDEQTANRTAAATLFLAGYASHLEWNSPATVLQLVLGNLDGQHALQVNRQADVLWYGKEAWEDVLPLFLAVTDLRNPAELASARKGLELWEKAAAESEYQVEKLIDAARALATPKKTVRKKAAVKPAASAEAKKTSAKTEKAATTKSPARKKKTDKPAEPS